MSVVVGHGALAMDHVVVGAVLEVRTCECKVVVGGEVGGCRVIAVMGRRG